jgi:ribonuclease D
MSRRMKFTPQGFVDLQKMVANHNIEDISLQKIYAILFQKKISKSQRLTNWEANELTVAQQKYAALDAWACLKIYENLCLTNTSI